MKQRTVTRVLILVASLLSLTSPVRKIVDKIFWDQVFKIASPFVPAITDNLLSITLFAATIYFWAKTERGVQLLEQAKAKVNPYFLTAGVAAVVMIISLFMGWQAYRQGPIDWVVDSPGSPLELWRNTAGTIRFAGFRVLGGSEANYPIGFTDAYIVSDVTKQRVILKVGIAGGEIPLTEAILEPRGNLSLWGAIPSSDEELRTGVSLDRLRAEFGAFTLVISYDDGRKFQKSFTRSQVEQLIAKATKEQAELQQQIPGIVPKRP